MDFDVGLFSNFWLFPFCVRVSLVSVNLKPMQELPDSPIIITFALAWSRNFRRKKRRRVLTCEKLE